MSTDVKIKTISCRPYCGKSPVLIILRKKYGEAADSLIKQTIECIVKFIKKNSDRPIENYTLVGDPLYLPMIQKSLKEEFKDIVVLTDDPDIVIVKYGLIYNVENLLAEQ